MEKLIVDLSRASKKRADVDGKGFVGLTLMHSHLKMGIIFFSFFFFLPTWTFHLNQLALSWRWTSRRIWLIKNPKLLCAVGWVSDKKHWFSINYLRARHLSSIPFDCLCLLCPCSWTLFSLVVLCKKKKRKVQANKITLPARGPAVYLMKYQPNNSWQEKCWGSSSSKKKGTIKFLANNQSGENGLTTFSLNSE